MSRFIFASIDNGRFKISVTDQDSAWSRPFLEHCKTFALDEVDKMARFLKQFKKQTSIATSSSIDFPENDGAPKGFNARVILGQAMQLAWR